MDTKTFLFLRGLPGAGKITVAKELEKQGDWKVIWLHAIKNVVYDIVRNHDLSGLMRQMLEPLTEYLLKENQNIIFIRPATEIETVHRMQQIVERYPNYRFKLVTMIAQTDTLIDRVSKRNDIYRIDSPERFNEYMSRSGKLTPFSGDELIIDTTNLKVEEVVEKINAYIKDEKRN